MRKKEVQRGHNAVVLDEEIMGVLDEDGQFILVR